MKRVILLFVFLGLLVSVTAQTTTNTEWNTYLKGYHISHIADAGEYLWLISYKEIQDEYSWHATEKEIIQFEKASGNTIHYGFDILGISPEYFIRSIKCDKNGFPWVCGDFRGILRMVEDNEWIFLSPVVRDSFVLCNPQILIADDGAVWTSAQDILTRYNGEEVDTFRVNGLINSLAEDKDRNIWIGTSNGFRFLYDGLIKFEGENMTIYNSSSTGLPPMSFREIIFDEQGNKWMTASLGFLWVFGGNKLVKFDDSEWQVFDLPVEVNINSIALQNNNLFWLGTEKGLLKFSNLQWTVLDTENSELPSNEIYSIVIDNDGTKWIGTENGLAAFNEKGLTTLLSIDSKMKNEIDFFPNPANDFVTLRMPGGIQNSTVDILNIQGKVIKSFCLSNDQNRLDVSHFPAGVYLVRIKSQQNYFLKKFVKQ